VKHPCIEFDCPGVPARCPTSEQAKCQKVRAYVAGIGPANMPTPIGMTTLSPHGKEGGKDMMNTEIEPETKVCQRPNCKHGGKPQLIENFRPDSRCADGRKSACKECEAAHAARFGRSPPKQHSCIGTTSQEELAPKKPPAPETEQPTQGVEGDAIYVLTEIWTQLEEIAKAELRRPIDQLHYLIIREHQLLRARKIQEAAWKSQG